MDEATFWDRAADARLVGEGEEDVQWIEEREEEAPQDVIGLLNLGKLTGQLDVRGHAIILRTLTMEEELSADLFISKYEGTMAYGRAQATIYVAAAIESIDGKPIVQTLGPGEDILRRKFDYVRQRMYWPVIKFVYEEGYIPLIERQAVAVDDFRKK
jgi:hypothetical protein